AFFMHDAETTAVGEHLLADFVLPAHPRPEDVRPTLRFQVRDRFLTDHAAVGDNAHLANLEAPPQAVDDGDQRGHVGRVAWPELAADRPTIAIEHRADDHLMLIGTMIFAVT